MNLDTEFKGLPVAEAAFYTRLGLRLEVLTLSEVSEWVDEVLLRENSPDAFFWQLYRLLRTGRAEIPAYLNSLYPASVFSVRPALGWLQRQLAAGTWPLSQLVQALYRLRTLVESDLEVGWIYGLAADYERATAGLPEALALQEVQRETEAFLECYHDYTFANRPQWRHLDAALEQRLVNLRH